MQWTNENKLKPKVCESCGEAFGCGATLDGCWCTEIDLPQQAADVIRNDFKDCLCRKCLTKLAGEPEIG